jgi:hypothetical protein
MPKRGDREWLSRVARGLTSGALALSVLSWGAGTLPAAGARPALAEDIDCYNDKDLYNLPECVERRAIDIKTGNAQNEAQGATSPPGGQQDSGTQQAGGGGGGNQPQSGPPPQQTSSGGNQQGSGGPPSQQASGGGQQSSSQQSSSQQASGGGQPANDEEADDKPAPRGPLTDPKQAVLTLEDAGKEATQFMSDEGSDKYGKFARTRFERDRSNGASALGPNVMDSKVWVAKDVETAKQLFKDQAAVKDFPERKENVQGGPIEKIKPTSYGDEFAYTSGYVVDDKVWQHWRFQIRVGNAVAVIYLFGREEFFQDQKDKDKGWTGQADWFTSKVSNRL